ncbi:hypothetical protein ACXJY6_00065 [Vibrio sp. RC27]
MNSFQIPQIRDLLMSRSMQGKSNSTVRLFVSRHLNALEAQGLLTSKGKGRKKIFSKTALFLDSDLQPNQKPQKYIPKKEDAKTTNRNACMHELVQAKLTLEAELTILLAETEEYQSIMLQYPEAKKHAKKLHEQSTQHSAVLTGKVTAMTKIIELAKAEVALC